MTAFINYLILPGLVFSFLAGGMGWWLERKLTARFQYRVGPPWYQSFIDVAKLFFKETIIPHGASKTLFIISPLISFSAVSLFSLMVVENYFFNKNSVGDILVILYLLVIPSLFIILGAFSSRNPLALVGAARETKIMLAYEFVFIISIVIVIIKSGGGLTLSDIAQTQQAQSIHIKSWSGLIGFILAIFYLQAKLCIVPFDAAEAEQEIIAGTMIEYSGPLLAFYKLSKLLLYFSLPLFIISLFAHIAAPNPFYKYLWLLVEYIIIILLVSVIKNVNPRLRIKDILAFFWFLLFPLGIIGIILAIKGS
ncbi:MAG: NADH-quinone oxidoreductase subunit H [Candidatus Omnitrophota bacterium]|nr:NADH-quinone oxidoreductase subunit H [Candidatus Omnitrophota bacterium]